MPVERLAVLAALEDAGVLAKHLAGCVARDALESGVDVLDRPLDVGDHDDLGRLLDCGRQTPALLTFPPPLRHIAHGSERADNGPVLDQLDTGELAVEPGAVAGLDPQFEQPRRPLAQHPCEGVKRTGHVVRMHELGKRFADPLVARPPRDPLESGVERGEGAGQRQGEHHVLHCVNEPVVTLLALPYGRLDHFSLGDVAGVDDHPHYSRDVEEAPLHRIQHPPGAVAVPRPQLDASGNSGVARGVP